MNEELKRKLYNYEENPPEKTWDRIAQALNGEIINEFTQKLYNSEITPPVNAWNKIAAALETNIQGEYAGKLYDLEIAPPEETWQKISTALNEENALPRIPSKRKIILLVRYAVAAAFIGVIAYGAFKLLNQKNNNNNAVAAKTVPPQKNLSNSLEPGNQKNRSAQIIPALSNNLPKQSSAFAKTNAFSKKRASFVQTGYMTQSADVSSSISNSSSLNFQQASLKGEVPGNCSLISDADRYLNFMNPDGYLIRMSKKLAEALGCFYTNGNSQEYNHCQEQIKKWRDKIAQSPASSSPDNFMDLLDIIKSVQGEL
jgi:hypothetical protein